MGLTVGLIGASRNSTFHHLQLARFSISYLAVHGSSLSHLLPKPSSISPASLTSPTSPTSPASPASPPSPPSPPSPASSASSSATYRLQPHLPTSMLNTRSNCILR
ncbi:hypothetical protein GQ43DRAFT_466189 [Delitschia confertaspora ATCC 74209]|uniref:Uncharacterized protein n=1 Tax=Delitschia confertaspora ATCC 74209 TaxID=1513339 RepID=A0A9P4JE14_9PLEO|nr:hypothetical protein GQ43DRAFT_466189 [Delitschia confertaspora ATCC 74209]